MTLIAPHRSGFKSGTNSYVETQGKTGMDFDIFIATSKPGTNLFFSIEIIVCLLTPALAASSSWVRLMPFLKSLTLFTSICKINFTNIINYFVKDFEKEKITSKYDVIIILEVLEHLNNWEKFLKKIKLSLKKNGILIISTINRNLVSKFLTLDIGENLLKLIPLNTHTFYKFIKPEELEQVLSSNNFENIKFKGLNYDVLKLRWKLSKNTKINYFCSCKLN